ncbi:hypothetical protein [Neobacillus dielmonensis]|uniref:hypothetical protein n=1 Tax=Neobacillus dielmonensis TaxID=1347369 RepID=UPI0005A9664C|nr:hypothetical protein [Neobacillus dielmonensis]
MELDLIKADLQHTYKELREQGFDSKESFNKILIKIEHQINHLTLSIINKKTSSMTLEDLKKLTSIVYKNVGEWVQAPKVIFSDLLPSVLYDYPRENGNNPFNIECNDKYFISANGLSYSYSKYLSESEIFHDCEIYRKIPMGYKVLCSYEKMVFIKNGEMIKSLEEIPEQVEGDHYTILTTSEYLGIRGYQNAPDLSLVDISDYSGVKHWAICLSKQDNKGIYLVCKNNANINWH